MEIPSVTTSEGATMTEIHVRRADGQSHQVVAVVGDLVVVHLSEPGATGYQWTASITGDAVTEESTALVVPEPAAPGQAGDRSFGFRAVAVGTAQLTLTLARAWEDGAGADRLDVRVDVSG
jgi:predicted secreted protein